MATTTLGNKAVGSIIQLKENGKLVSFYVAKHNYENSLNGMGRTLVVRKDCYDTRQWHSSNVNAYASSAIDILRRVSHELQGLSSTAMGGPPGH